ncbi:MAG: hypothetical protein MJ225_01810 [Bacilli bacterium]|nr:hypothetical protein [Bacilli bacterium]
MKEKLNLRNILAWGGALLAIIAFFVCMTAGLKGSAMYDMGMVVNVNMKGLIIGTQKAVVDVPIVGKITEELPNVARPTLSLIGIILAIVAAIAVVVVSFVVKDEKTQKIITLVCGVVIVVAAVLVLLLKSGYISALANKVGADKEAIKETYADMNLNGGAIATAVMLILGGGVVIASTQADKLVAKK